MQIGDASAYASGRRLAADFSGAALFTVLIFPEAPPWKIRRPY